MVVSVIIRYIRIVKLTHVDEPQIDMESKDFAGSYFLIHERKHRENKWKTHRKQSKNN